MVIGQTSPQLPPDPYKHHCKLSYRPSAGCPKLPATVHQCIIPTRCPVFAISRCEDEEKSPRAVLVTKEKVRIKLIRFMKKIVRFCKVSESENHFLETMLKKESRTKEKNGRLLKRCTKENAEYFRQIYRVYENKRGSGILDEFSCTESSPINTDARDKLHPQSTRKTNEKTWNDTYMASLMSDREVREFYLYYIDFLNEGKEDTWGRKLALALGVEAKPGLLRDLKEAFVKREEGEEIDTTYGDEDIADELLAI